MRWQSPVACGLIAAGLLGPARAEDVESPLVAQSAGEALRDGRLLLGLRPRFTWVDQDGRAQNAHWGSLRTTLGWQTLTVYGLRVTAEAIDVRHIDPQGAIDYTETPAYAGSIPGGPLYGPYTPGYYPLVVDPNTTDANRLFVDYTALPETLVRFGRQLVSIDNQRFIGAYDDAQLPQAFNGLFMQSTALRGTQLTAGYFARVRNSYAIQRQAHITVLNARFEPEPRLKLAGFGYLQNQAQTESVTGFSDNSNRIVGGRVWGAWRVRDETELVYSGELAQQRSYAGGDPLIRADYRRLGAGLTASSWYVRVDWERLGSNSGQYGFQTPLGSTQLFTGRTDVFATTPRIGLRDWRGTIGYSVSKAGLSIAFHRFRSDWSDTDLGHEVDVGVSWRFMPGLSATLEYADYRAGDATAGIPDTRKIWATLSYAY